jgi:hypothetical protein
MRQAIPWNNHVDAHLEARISPLEDDRFIDWKTEEKKKTIKML